MNRREQELFLKVLKTTLENSPYSDTHIKNHIKPTQLQFTVLPAQCAAEDWYSWILTKELLEFW